MQRAADGQPPRVVGLRMDNSRRKQTEQRLEMLAHTDPITGVCNRRRFLELVNDELSRAVHHGQSLAFLMMDLDHFKFINDQFGHATGDAVLRAFVAAAQRVMRQGDVVAQVGGEEFAALLPQTSREGARMRSRGSSAHGRRAYRAQPALLPVWSDLQPVGTAATWPVRGIKLGGAALAMTA